MFADIVTFLAVLGCFQCLAGWIAVKCFAGRPPSVPVEDPPVTILKPLCGDEPLLEEALTSCFGQNYPTFQIVFGLRDETDPALAVVRRVQARFPDCNITIVIDATLHGQNRKVSNLINMLPFARYDVLVISDSDLHLAPNYLQGLVGKLENSGAGLVTAAYFGLPPAGLGWQATLGATQITHNFLPGVLLSRVLGRQDCLGSTTMLHRDTLGLIGGLDALVHHLAEDNEMGKRVRDLGLPVRLADTVVGATVPESSIRALWDHEIRWMRTIRVSSPLALIASTLQYPLFWASIACASSGGALWSIAIYGGSWMVRFASVIGINSALRLKTKCVAPTSAAWLLPVRDILSVIEIGASYCIESVTWRGHTVNANWIVADPMGAQAEN